MTFFYVLLDFFDLKYFPKLSRFLDLSVAVLLAAIIIFWGRPVFIKTLAADKDFGTYCQNSEVQLPCRAIEKMKDKTGNVFNTYEWGGFLIWQLPNTKVFADGRMPAWQDEQGRYPYAVFLNIIQAQPGWDEELKKYGTDYLLIRNGTF